MAFQPVSPESDSLSSPPVLFPELPYFQHMTICQQMNQLEPNGYQDNRNRTLTPPERLSPATTPRPSEKIMSGIERERSGKKRKQPTTNNRQLKVPTHAASSVPSMSSVTLNLPVPTPQNPLTGPIIQPFVVTPNRSQNPNNFPPTITPINYTIFNPFIMSCIYNEQILQMYYNAINNGRFPPTATANFPPLQPVPPIFTMTPTTASNHVITNNILPRFAPAAEAAPAAQVAPAAEVALAAEIAPVAEVAPASPAIPTAEIVPVAPVAPVVPANPPVQDAAAQEDDEFIDVEN